MNVGKYGLAALIRILHHHLLVYFKKPTSALLLDSEFANTDDRMDRVSSVCVTTVGLLKVQYCAVKIHTSVARYPYMHGFLECVWICIWIFTKIRILGGKIQIFHIL